MTDFRSGRLKRLEGSSALESVEAPLDEASPYPKGPLSRKRGAAEIGQSRTSRSIWPRWRPAGTAPFGCE